MHLKKRAKEKKNLTAEEKKDKKLFAIAWAAMLSLIAIFGVLCLIFDSVELIDGKYLHDAVKCVLVEHKTCPQAIYFALYFLTLYLIVFVYGGVAIFILATKRKVKWLTFLAATSIVFIALSNILASGFLHAKWIESYEMHMNVCIAIVTIIMAVVGVVFVAIIKPDYKQNDLPNSTAEASDDNTQK